MDALDLKISRKLKNIVTQVEKIVRKEVGPNVGITLLLHPTVQSSAEVRHAELQYISNLPREHMAQALRMLLTKWEANVPDTPPHERGLQ